jgi:hypothetical protein
MLEFVLLRVMDRVQREKISVHETRIKMMTTVPTPKTRRLHLDIARSPVYQLESCVVGFIVRIQQALPLLRLVDRENRITSVLEKMTATTAAQNRKGIRESLDRRR